MLSRELSAMRAGPLERLVGKLRLLPAYLALAVFYAYGLLWTLKPRRVEDVEDVLSQFYYGFLRLRKEDVEVIRLTRDELVTISRNPCPILELSLRLGLDTRHTCRVVSETVCRFVLKRMDPRLRFWRDYERIRPYSDGCLERVYLAPAPPPDRVR